MEDIQQEEQLKYKFKSMQVTWKQKVSHRLQLDFEMWTCGQLR